MRPSFYLIVMRALVGARALRPAYRLAFAAAARTRQRRPGIAPGIAGHVFDLLRTEVAHVAQRSGL
jgi:hypothetical protein